MGSILQHEGYREIIHAYIGLAKFIVLDFRTLGGEKEFFLYDQAPVPGGRSLVGLVPGRAIPGCAGSCLGNFLEGDLWLCRFLEGDPRGPSAGGG